MVGRRRGFSQRRVREVGYDSSSPDPHTAALFWGSPSPTAPHFRRAPPSPGLRTRHQSSPSPVASFSLDLEEGGSSEDADASAASVTTPEAEDFSDLEVSSMDPTRTLSPMMSSSTDPGEVSSSEEGDASEAAVTASEVEDMSDLVGGMVVSSLIPDLSPILEDGGRTGVSSSSIFGSPVLSPAAAVLVCQATIDVGGRELVSSLSSSLLGADVSASSKRVDLAEAVAIDGEGLEVAVAYSRCSDVEGLCSSAVMSDDAAGASVPHLPLAGHPVEGSGFEGDSQDSEFAGGERDSPGASARDVSGGFCCAVTAGAHIDGGAEPLPSDSNLDMVVGPLSASSYSPIGGSVGHVGDGLVSEEGRVLPAAREALRSQPADGLRFGFPCQCLFVSFLCQCLVRSFQICSCPSLLWISPARLAPLSSARRREGVADGWTAWLTAYPDAHKRASDRVRARRLVKLVTKVTRVDDDFRGMIGCRRSGRLSSPACPASVVLGSGRSTDLKPIEEALASVGGEDIDGDEGVDLLMASVSGDFGPPSVESSDDSGEMMSCLHSRRCARNDANLDLRFELPSIAEETILASVESVEALNSSCCDESATRPVISGLSLPPIQVVSDSPSLLPLPSSAEFLRGGSSIVEDELGMEEMGEAVENAVQGCPEAVQAGELAVDCGVSDVQVFGE
ncbi:hypothetical protein Dimus_030473 [Dionaea muscipula]